MGGRYLPHALALAVLALAASAIVWSPVGLDDHWWHMLTGRYLLEHGQVPVTDPFSYTAHGQPWVNWEWLGGLLMVSAYDALGGGGLVLLRFAAVMTTASVLWLHLVRREERYRPIAWVSRLLVVGLVLLVVFGRVSDRPHLYALPFVAATHYLGDQAFSRRRVQPLLVLLAAMIPWVLLHPSWPLGAVVTAAVMAERFIADPEARRPRGPAALRWLYQGAPLLLVVPALVLLDVTEYASAVGHLFGSSSLREWQPLWTYLHWTNGPLVAFLLLSAGWLTAALTRPARLLRPSWLLSLALMLGSWWFVRFTPLFAIIAAPQIHGALADAWEAWDIPARTATLAAVLVGALLLLAVVETKSVFGTPYSAELDERATPAGVAAFMQQHDIGGNVLCDEMNAHAFLAFARYPHVHEYIDGRVPQLFDEAFWVAYTEALASPQRFAEVLTQSQTQLVVLQHPFAAERVPLVAELTKLGDFHLVHIDDNAMLWGRRDHLEALAAPPPSYRLVIPPLIDDGWFPYALSPKRFPRALEELTRLRAAQPQSKVATALIETLARHPAATEAQRQALGALLP